jgi:hypothetical protein
MKIRILLSAAILLCAAVAFAQQPGTVEHTADECMLGGEMPMMMVQTVDDGLLRGYFRRAGHIDWCSVDGKNLGKASNVILPHFEVGAEIEYYFVVIKGREVIAKSPKIYKTKAQLKCNAPFARHAITLSLECLPPGQNPMANAINAAIKTGTEGRPVLSPGKPEDASSQKKQ